MLKMSATGTYLHFLTVAAFVYFFGGVKFCLFDIHAYVHIFHDLYCIVACFIPLVG